MARKKGRDKTETIKQRAIYVYLPSIEMAEEWKRKAEKAGISISKFVIEHVENSLRQEEGEDFVSRADLIKRIRELENENKELQKKYEILSKAYEKLEEELKSYRRMPFYEKEYIGARGYEKELIKLFKKKKTIRSEELLDELGVSPHDTAAIKAINRQLENLELYGLIEPVMGGWKWRG